MKYSPLVFVVSFCLLLALSFSIGCTESKTLTNSEITQLTILSTTLEREIIDAGEDVLAATREGKDASLLIQRRNELCERYNKEVVDVFNAKRPTGKAALNHVKPWSEFLYEATEEE